MNRWLPALMALALLCGASSCSLYRRLSGKSKAAPAANSVIIAGQPDSLLQSRDTAAVTHTLQPADSAQAALLTLWLPLWNARDSFSTFSGRAKAHYESGAESEDFMLAIRIEKDRRIWMSITGSMFGLSMEAARVLVTPDSIIVLDRLHKEVRALPFAEADKLLSVPVSFGDFQSLITGSMFRTVQSPPAITGDTAQEMVLYASDSVYLQQAGFMKADTGAALLVRQSVASAATGVQCYYRNYAPVAGRRFANGRDIMLRNMQEMHRLTLDFTQAAFDEPVDMSFAIPEKYERK